MKPYNLVVKSEGSGVRLPGLKFWLFYLLCSFQQVILLQEARILSIKCEFGKLQKI